jgi:hypothetical protein
VRVGFAAAGSIALGLAGCEFPDEASGDLDLPLAMPSGDVRSFEAATIEAIVTEVAARFRAYAALREAIPFALVTGDACTVVSTVDAATVRADTDLACALGDAGGGAVSLVQTQDAAGDLRLTVRYEDAFAHGVAVAGEERIARTDAGVATHGLDLIQDSADWRYTFRAGELSADRPVFDYLVPGPGGDVPVRLTNAETFGGFATVTLFGLDGLLRCDLRASEPSLGVRGTCDNGVVFGLP